MTAAAGAMPLPGFADPVFDAQASFRAILDAMARPGTIRRLVPPAEVPWPLSPAASALALTLFDHDTPVWLDGSAESDPVVAFLRFHCGCPLVERQRDAAFAVVADAAAMPPLHAYAIGEDRYPETSTTVVVGLPALEGGDPVTLAGPGIEHTARIAPRGLPDGFWRQFADNRALFPLGVDVVLTAGDQALCLPRSIRTEI